MRKVLSIGAAVKLLEIPRRKIYYLEEVGQIRPVPRSTSGERVFPPETIREIRAVLKRIA